MSKKDWQLLKAYQATGLTPEEVERVKRERDALMAVVDELRPCHRCKHFSYFGCKIDGPDCKFEWRGVKEDICKD